MHRLHVVTDPDRLYFAHMTVYPNGRKERLHGHNFRVFLDLDLLDGSFAKMVDLDVARDALEAICKAWKERLLLATQNRFFELVRDDAAELEFRLCGKRYVVPREEAVLLPIENASVEGLAEHIAQLLRPHLAPLGALSAYEVRLEELPGIGSSYRLAL
jgi:6-pyruvoyltetrahydropterin/6-carboxytetrahydropterin synthase